MTEATMFHSNIFSWFQAAAGPGQNTRDESICGEKEFLRVLARERARAERGAHRFSLVVFETGTGEKSNIAQELLLGELSSRLRATDEAGWLRKNRIGTILHNANIDNARSFAINIRKSLLADGIQLPFKIYTYPPQKNDTGSAGRASDSSGSRTDAGQRFSREYPVGELHQLYAQDISSGKRALDLIGSMFGLILLSPVFILLWAVIKTVSPGPALYKQTRIGWGGRPFTLLKFRTMGVNADTTEHCEYLASLIQGEKTQQGCARAMAKLDDNDNKIIPFGKLIRKTYLDELPQLINVLRGDMSLIGPRPPIPYEVAEYQLWHTGRLDATPGMTGLWQVSGKNRLSFEQMVRLDIRYTRQQSFWLDLKILFMTPIAIASELKMSLSKIGLNIGIESEKVKYWPENAYQTDRFLHKGALSGRITSKRN
jgi:lipopolysaccharide/colanic/teichoic acid biosynthesis glycosyltransferase